MAKLSVSRISSFVLGYEQDAFWIGIDAHKSSYSVALRRPDEQTLTWIAPASPSHFVHQIKQIGIPVAGIAYEAGPTGFALARELRSAGYNVIVAAPSRIPRPVTAGAKCDRLDCIKLSSHAARGNLRPIAIPSVEDEALRSVLRRRHRVRDQVRRCKQRIKSHLLYLGLKAPAALTHWRSDCAEAVSRLAMHEGNRAVFDSLFRELTFHTGELGRIERQLADAVKSQQHVRHLKSVAGVGSLVAASFALELFRPERFERADQVTSYLGLAPMVRQSGQRRSSARLRPVGQSRLRSLLIEAAWTWKSKDAYAGGIYNRILARTGLAQKAICAVARKLAIILWRLMIEGRDYRPQSQSA